MTTTPERTATLTALVAAEIRAWMGRLDVRQSELARKLGESDQWLSMRLRGRTPLDINEMQRIARALGIGVHELLPNPDLADQAAAPPAIAHYFEVAERTSDHHQRPPDNRPPGRPAAGAAATIIRTAHLPRSNRRRRDR